MDSIAMILDSAKHEKINAEPDDQSDERKKDKKNERAFGLEPAVELRFFERICRRLRMQEHNVVLGKTISAGRAGS